MKLKSLFTLLSAAMLVSLLGVGTAFAAGDQATMVISNSFNAGMTFTLDGTAYTIAPGSGLVITVPAGKHTYAGNIPGWENASGTINLPAGQTFSLMARTGRIDSIFDAKGNVLDPSSFQYGLTWMEFWQGPAGNRLPVQAPTDGTSALVFEHYLGSSLDVDSGFNYIYSVLPYGRLELIKPATPVRYTVSAALISDKAQTGVNGVIGLAPGQVSALAFGLDSGGNMTITDLPASSLQ